MFYYFLEGTKPTSKLEKLNNDEVLCKRKKIDTLWPYIV